MNNYFLDKNRKTKKTNLGFTLVEILVVLSLIAILGAIMISSNYRTVEIRNSLLTDSEAIAIELRDMQNRTTSFVEVPGVANVGYGVYFDISNPNKIESFYKMYGNDFSTSEVPDSASSGPTEDLILNVGDKINRICLNSCANTTAKLAIYFIKPKPYIYFSRSEDSLSFSKYTSSNNPISHVCIEIIPSSSTDVRRVDVYYVGQISFSYGACE